MRIMKEQMFANREVVIMILAIDFDGTLCVDEYPNIGAPNLKLINELIYRREQGDRLILWTCRSGLDLVNAVAWCELLGLQFDAINDNLPEVIEEYHNNSRKITADVYIDDRSVKPWEALLQKVG